MSHVPLMADDLPHTAARDCFTAPLPRVDSLAALGLRVSRVFAQCRRESGQLAMLWVEVDVLERPGHAPDAETHDSVIQAVSQRLRNRVRGSDEVVRVGEHSFAVLLMAAGPLEADLVEQRLTQAVRGAYGVEHHKVMHVSVRLGQALFPAQGRNGTELAEAARRQVAG
jgi:diguanylate cyclase (GGDEF)-like protein